MTRLERSVELLQAVNSARRLPLGWEWHHRSCSCDYCARRIALERRLEQHDADARNRVNPRQLTIFDAIDKGGGQTKAL